MIRLTSATAIGLVLAASPALAEITPLSVWEQLESYYETIGFAVETEAVEEAGATVTVRGLRLLQETPTSKTEALLGDLVLNSTGDGGVSLDMADEMTATMTLEVPKDEFDEMDLPDLDDGAEPAEDTAEDTAENSAEDTEPHNVTFDVTMRMSGDDITVHEDGAGYVYEYTVPTLEMALDRVVGTDGKIIENPGKAVITDISSKDRIETGGDIKATTASTIGNLQIDFDVAEEGEDGSAQGTVAMADLVINSASTVPAGSNLGAGLADAMKAGLDITGDLQMGKTDMQIAFSGMSPEGETQDGSLNSSTESMTLDFLMAEGRVGYSGKSGPSSVDANLPGLPVPVSYAAESARFDIEFPVNAGAEPQPFKVVYGFDGLTLSDSIWGLFDPQSLLPRDPAQVLVDLAGLVTLDVDIFNPDAMDDAAEAPGEFNALTVNNVQVSALGADVAVTGELTSPEGGNLTTPIGVLNGRLTGINALFDTLGKAGLLPEEQAMGMRMMLAMFAKPDPADENVLTSEIEFKEGGQIFANGQQVK